MFKYAAKVTLSLLCLASFSSQSAILSSEERLMPGGSIFSDNGQYRLTLQSDGNLVMYRNDNAVTWHSHTSGRQVSYASMQADGNFVLYDASAQAVWNSRTSNNPGAVLSIQDDGNLVIYKPQAIWATMMQPENANGISLIPAPTTGNTSQNTPAPPFSSSLSTLNICGNSPLPTGFIAVAYSYNSACGIGQYNQARIQKYTDARVGSELTICTYGGTPVGWVIVGNILSGTSNCPAGRTIIRRVA
jgi:hypothetical protein